VDYRMIAVDILADKLKDQKLEECPKKKGKSPITFVSKQKLWVLISPSLIN
jgi:hypothetical protein